MPQRRLGRQSQGARYEADYVSHIGKAGWQDWNLVPFAVENDYIVVTLNRRDFLKQQASLEIHPGLVILMPQAPNDRRIHQANLFEKALAVLSTMNDDLVNKIMEVLEDGSVHIREWNADAHDIGHIGNPEWR